MNRAEAYALLAPLNTVKTTVNGQVLRSGFFFADALAVLETFERTCRVLSALTATGKINCTPVHIGGTTHDLYHLA